MAEFGWAYVAGGAITGAAGPTGSIQVKKSGTEIGGYSELVWNNTTKAIELSGALTASTMNFTDLSSGTGVSSKFLALDSNNNVVLTSSAGSGGGGTDITIKDEGSDLTTTAASIDFVGAGVTATTSGNDVTVTINGGGGSSQIGAAEDGDYTDGLFTDFTTTTLIGVPIDRFNEVLKILAPSPAPALSRVNSDNTAGSTVKLSFGSSNALTDYTSSNTAAGFDAIDVNGTYENETSGSNFRLGAYKNDTDITGFLNFHVVENSQNGYLAYSTDAFGNAETGSLKLELNGNIIHTVDLSGLTGTGNPNTGSANSLTGDSGFTNVSVTASSFDGNNSEWYIFKHRTAKIKVDVNDMVPGWNYVRAIHTIGSTDYATNYIEWINDPSGSTNDLSVTNARIEDISLVGSKYLSGVEYNTDATANYKADINNLYRNVYAASGTPVSFTVTNSTTPSAQSVAAIGGSEDHTKILGVTASLDYNGNSLVSGSITANTTVTHPFKATISNQGSATTGDGFLIDNRTLASTNLSEKFHDETFRKTSGSYDAQSSVTNSSGTWNSQSHMAGGGAEAGHEDGLLFFNQRLYSPVDGDIPAGGDFSSLSNVESGQPDYSSVTGTRTFYRVISQSYSGDLYNMRISSTKNSTTYNNSTLSTANVQFFVKIPGTTGWMDISQNFTYGSITDGDGALISGASNDVDSGNNTHNITFGTASVAEDDHIMIKILADESWSGYISQLDFTLPANQNQATPQVLSDINASNTGAEAKLSFGASNAIPDYSNANGASISLTSFDSNENYSVSGDRRGIFTSAPTIAGTLNDAIGGDGGGSYPADALFNGYSGSLVLEVNGSDVHTVALDGTLNAITNDFNGNSSGFDLSAVNFSTLSGIPHYTKPYRTGTYQIGAGDQRDGWNYARVKHGSNTTNYVEWIIDVSGAVNDTAVSTPVFSDFDHNDVYYQSGIGYFASRPSASFAFTASNFYRNVYQNGTGITFPTTDRCSISNIRVSGSGIHTTSSATYQLNMPLLNNSTGCEQADFEITGTVLFDSLTSISGGLGLFTHYDVEVRGQVAHPFKTDRSTDADDGQKFSFMVYSGSNGSTDLGSQEYFNTEAYRIVSGNYATQADVTSSSNAWNSQRSMNDGSTYPEHNDGMVVVNGFAISPLKIGNAGDTRNNSEGSTGLQAPSGNPNYSTSVLSESVRTYYRYFRNTGVTTVQNFNIYVEGDATIVAKTGSVHYGALGANDRINIEMKVPGQTAWGDVAIPQGGINPTADGNGIFNGGNGNLDQDASNGSNVAITLGELFWASNDYIVLKISAHKDWTGYLTEITASY